MHPVTWDEGWDIDQSPAFSTTRIRAGASPYTLRVHTTGGALGRVRCLMLESRISLSQWFGI